MSNDYDALDLAYRKIWGAHLHHGLWEFSDDTLEGATEHMAQRVIKVAEISPTHHVCDIGCGYGATARKIVRDTGAQVTAVTNSRKQFEAATVEGNKNPHYVLATWPEHAFAPESFDRVIVIEALEHMPERRKALHAMAEVLKPGGRLLLHTWLKKEVHGWRRSILLDPIQREGELPGMAEEEELREELAKAGFTVITHEDLSDRVAHTWTAALGRALCGVITDAELRRFCFAHPWRNMKMALALVRVRIAYALGVIEYRAYVAERGP